MIVEAELQKKLCSLHAAKDEGAGSEGSARDAEPRAAETLLARIAWSRISEPGDGTAGIVLAALGPVEALRHLIEGTAPSKLAAAVAEAGGSVTTRAAQLAVGRWVPRLNRSETVADIDRAIAAGLRVVTPGDQHWPIEAFGGLGDHAPALLWLRGDPELLCAPSLSVVGARASTGYGTHMTAEIVGGVCDAGLTIVSGAAYGVDAVAHRTALAVQSATVAVLAGGADRAYPAAHESLLDRIAREGLVCAEMIPGAAPTRWRFRQRNRIIAALSGATLVTEAGLRSGTINTAGHAAELGRPLGAVPGPVTSAASAGCHKLIREYGAMLVTNARDACELLGVSEQVDIREDAAPGADGTRTPPLHERILDAVPLRGYRETPEIARRAGLGLDETRGGLAELELLGRVRRGETPGGDGVKWALQRRR